MSASRTAFIAIIAAVAAGLAVGLYARPPRDVSARAEAEPVSATLSKLDQRLASLQRANESLRAQLAAQGQPRPIIDTTSGRPLVEKAEVQAPGPEPEAALAQADPVAAFDALEEGRTLLDRAVARGRWSNDDRANLHRLLARTDSDGTSELLTALATAINSDKLLPVL